jgi:hypothetical protein
VEVPRYATEMKAMLTHAAAAKPVRTFGVVIIAYVVSTPFRMNKSFCE